MVHRICQVCAVLALIGLASTAVGAADFVFGPETLELTAGEIELFEMSFSSTAAGPFVLYLHNGSGETNRVFAASVELNGALAVAADDFGEDSRHLVRMVELQVGINELAVVIEGEVGSFVTLAIAPHGARPVFVAGRLLLPWGRADDQHLLSLALRNDSPMAPRVFRALFYSPGGEIVAASKKMPVPPRGSLAVSVEELIDVGSWTVGSIEVIYAGPGRGRMFGTARQSFLSPVPQTDTQPLVQVGFGVVGPQPPPPGDGPRPRP